MLEKIGKKMHILHMYYVIRLQKDSLKIYFIIIIVIVTLYWITFHNIFLKHNIDYNFAYEKQTEVIVTLRGRITFDWLEKQD